MRLWVPGAKRAPIREDIGLSFDDVLLSPKRGVLVKRADADLSAELVSGLELQVPIVSAPMQSVTERILAREIHALGGFGILHRFMSVSEQAEQFHYTGGTAGVAIGINEGYERWQNLFYEGCRVFCLDVAHAHHESVYEFIEGASSWAEECKLIVGNIATFEAARYLAELPIAAVKVGIGPGAACTTRVVTGFGVPQLTAIMDVADALDDTSIKIIADGGIKNSGDIVKALAAGADTVMIGRLLAGADESPHPGLYWGMASHRVNGHRAPEGVEGVVSHTGPLENTIKELTWGIRSGLSYAGARNLRELRQNAEFIRVTPQSMGETGVRI